jgi:hypothetical protein
MKFKRIFRRTNADGTENVVEISWDKENPMSTFSLETSGYSGINCLSELENIEALLGSASITEKSEMYGKTDEQEVFIVGFCK